MSSKISIFDVLDFLRILDVINTFFIVRMKKIQGLTFLFFFAAAIASGQTDTTTVATDDEFVPVITLSATDFEGDDEAHDISGLLQGSHDIFLSTAGYTFGSARFRIRGYNSENSSVLINGVPVNDPETGRAYYSTWGGLND